MQDQPSPPARPPVAGMVRRLSAGAIDALVPFVLLPLGPALLWTAQDPSGRWGDGVTLVRSPLVLVGYYALYSLLAHWRWRKTLGKRICGISVVHLDGSDCARSTLFGRELIRGASLGVLSVPLVLFSGIWIDAMIREWVHSAHVVTYWDTVLFALYVYFVAPVVTAVLLCPILFRKRGYHDFAADTMVVDTIPQGAGGPHAYLTQEQQVVIVFMGAPALIVAALLSPNVVVFLGILVVAVFGFAVVRALYERIQR